MKYFIFFAMLLLLATCSLAVMDMEKLNQIEEQVQNMSEQLQEQQTQIAQAEAKQTQMRQESEEQVFLVTDASLQTDNAPQAENKTIIDEQGNAYELGFDEIYARSKAKGKLKSMELKIENEKLVYNIKTLREGKLFSIIPMNVTVMTRVDALTGQATEKLPWYSFAFTELDQ
ncbi:MAG: hypothetical protein KJ574_05260 [Nanoarchaeota archaeon]|nr:hypothetical protein [Nanoarchaeota archaeon]